MDDSFNELNLSFLDFSKDTGLAIPHQGLTDDETEAFKNAFAVDVDHVVSLTDEEITMLFIAKCEDQNLVPTPVRAKRFLELMKGTCSGSLLSLRSHGLASAGAQTLSKILAYNKAYSVLELCGNRLHDEGTIELAGLFQNNETIVRLDLRSNDIGGRGAEALFNTLCNNKTLTALDLSGLSGVNRNHISLRGSSALSRCLQLNQIISHLNLGSNGLGADGIKALCVGLNENSSLVVLDLNSNSMGVKGCEAVASVLPSLTSLEKLKLSRNSIGDRGCAALCKALETAYTETFNEGAQEGDTRNRNTVLSQLDLCENKISGQGLRDFCEALQNEYCTLQRVQFDRNAIGDAGAENIAKLLEKNKSIQSLTINRCEIQQHGATLIAKALERNKILRKLDISGNYIDEENLETMPEEEKQKYLYARSSKGVVIESRAVGSKAFANALTVNNTLLQLDLSKNRIQNEGGYALAKSLSINRSMVCLFIRENDLKDVEYIGSGPLTAESPTAKANCDMNGAKESRKDKCGEKFAAAMKKNTTLLELDFSYNSFRYKTYTQIHEYIKRNMKSWKKNQKYRLQDRITVLSSMDQRLVQLHNEIQKEEATEKEQYALNKAKKAELESKTARYAEEHSNLDKEIKSLSEERAIREKEFQEATNNLERSTAEIGVQMKKLKSKWSTETQRLENAQKHIKKTRREIRDTWTDIKTNNPTIFETLDRVTKEKEEIMKVYPEQEEAIQDMKVKVAELEKVLEEEEKAVWKKSSKRDGREQVASRGGRRR